MSLDIRRAVEQGFDDLTSEAGLNVLSALVVFNIAYGSVVASFRQQLVAFIRGGERQVVSTLPPLDLDALTLELPLSLLAVAAVVAVVASEAIRFWAIRLFADVSLPERGDRLNVLLAVGSGFALLILGLRELLPLLWVGEGFNTTIRVTQGAALAAAPLLLVFVYLRQEIALGDGGATETVRNAVARFRDAPGRIFFLMVCLLLLGQLTLLPNILVTTVMQPVTDSAVGLLVSLLSIVLWAITTTVSIAAVTDAYLQVSGRATD